MDFNCEKGTDMHTGKNNTRQCYHLKGNELAIVGTEKDLGVTFSDSFGWSEHVEQSIGKAKKTKAWILRNIFSGDPDVLLLFYKSMIRPLIIYIEMILECDWSISVQLIPNRSDKNAKICNKSAKICNNSAKFCNKRI